MRSIGVLILLVALPAFAEEPKGAEIEMRYVENGTELCRERFSGYTADFCITESIRTARELAGMERGDFVYFSLELDGDGRARPGAAEIARVCRERTMDGKLVDSLSAMTCVTEEIGRRNWEARRAKRLQSEEVPGDE